MSLEKNPSPKMESHGGNPKAKTLLAANVRGSAKALLLIGSLLSSSCSLGIKEMTKLTEQCGTVDTCQKSIDQIVDKGVKPITDQELAKQFALRLNGNLESVQNDLYARVKDMEQSLKDREKKSAPNDWVQRMGKNPNQAALATLMEETQGILDVTKQEEWEFIQTYTPSGYEKLRIIADLTQKWIRLKQGELAAKAKYSWLK